MESNRFDQEFKDKLDKRVISPSEDAWSILSERLDCQDKNRNNKGYWLLGLAASLVGILLVVTQLESGVKDITDEIPKIVVTPNNDLNEEHINTKKQNNLLEKNDSEEEIVLADEGEGNEKTNSNLVIVENINKENISLKKEKQLHAEELTFEEQKIQEVVAQVQALENENKVVTEADVDALLVEAQKEIAINRLSQQTTGSVDANALLESVEQELDKSFRDKVFEAIKTSYNSVKTAVAQRNE